MSDEPQLKPASRTETTTRTYDEDGRLTEEQTVIVTKMKKQDADPPIGQYL